MTSITTIRELLAQVESLRKQHRHTRASAAPNFNLFRILGVEEKEVSTHSAFLADLLNPSGTHEQGDLFLRKFLEEIGYASLGVGGWTVSQELPFARGRLDIVLQSKNAAAIIVVENKIGTTDHEHQLSAYHTWLNAPRRRRAFRTRLLLYLTPNGDEAKNTDEKVDYKAISYKSNSEKPAIADWLRSCSRPGRIKAPPVADCMQTYLQTIENLNTQSFMKDHLDNDILNLLKKPTNRAAALRIARVGNLLKGEMLRDFWDRGEKFLGEQMTREGLTSYWKIDRRGESPLDEYQIGLVAKRIDQNKPHPRFCFYQYSTRTRFRWELAVKIDNWLDKNIGSLPEAKKLIRVLDERCSMPTKHGWDGYFLVTEDSKGVDRILEEQLMSDKYFSAFFEKGWEVFREIEPYLRKLNNAMRVV
jgi:hypothetical protein